MTSAHDEAFGQTVATSTGAPRQVPKALVETGVPLGR